MTVLGVHGAHGKPALSHAVVALKRETELSLSPPYLMVLTVLEMIQTHKTAVQMAAQVMIYFNKTIVMWSMAKRFHSTKLTVLGVHGAHGKPAL